MNIVIGFDTILQNDIDFLLKFMIYHDFSHRDALEFKRLPQMFRDPRHTIAAYNIVSLLFCRGAAAVAIGLTYPNKQQP